MKTRMRSIPLTLLSGCLLAGSLTSPTMATGVNPPSLLESAASGGQTTLSAPAATAEKAKTDGVKAAPVRKAHRPRTERDYLGKWIGVEGTLLEVGRGTNGKLVVVNFWSLDAPDRGSFDAEVVPEGLRWTRKGTTVVGRPTNGAGTGLKWLDGKRDCLTVAKGEGYCRD